MWASNVDFSESDFGATDEAHIEVDLYAGMTGKVGDLGWKFGGLYYNYPGVSDNSGLKYDYWEFGPTLTYPVGPATASLLVLWSPNFYNETGKGLYSELGLSAPVGSFTLGGTFGHQDIERNAEVRHPGLQQLVAVRLHHRGGHRPEAGLYRHRSEQQRLLRRRRAVWRLVRRSRRVQRQQGAVRLKPASAEMKKAGGQ